MLPADGHVHSEWSYDAPCGSMYRTCARAAAVGLPAIAFTEHADYTTWTAIEGLLTPPELDVEGYLECIQQCRERFPDLRIMSGVELGEPHWHKTAVAALLGAGKFDRVLGSLHCLAFGQQIWETANLYQSRAAADVVRDYLAEVPRLVDDSDAFSVLAHIDYPLRNWPKEAGSFDPDAFQEEFRYALRVLADSDRALEINTEGPLYAHIVRWWRDEGGMAVTFGSDAHEPDDLARQFRDAAAMAEACGFRPGSGPFDPWPRA